MYKGRKKRLGDLLVEVGIITKEQLVHALSVQKKSGKKLGEILVSEQYVTEEQIIEVLEIQLGIAHVILADYDIDTAATTLISESLAKRHDLIPIKKEGNVLTVAMSDPLNIFAIDDVKIYSGLDVEPVIASTNEIGRAIDICYGEQEAMKAAEEYKKEYGIIEQAATIEGNLEDVVNSAPIVKLVNSVIEQGVRIKASDIHIEPYNKDIRIRYRVDGQLKEGMRHEIQLLPAIVTRIKISGEMNIAEKRKPQDGRISMMVDQNDYDLRVSILPTVYGEKVVIRIIDKNSLLKSKDTLGFFKDDLEKFKNILKNPYGIILITGPAGSGKTTTLYTTIRELNNESINIITVEDPVETRLEGVNQVQVNPKAGLDFAGALRAFLRQDPNIIMIGEIRDAETVEIAVRAAVTGHLVVSTLHTNDAASTVARLLDMNIERFLISTSLVGIISQRLIRKICPKCKVMYKPSDDEMKILGLTQTDNITIQKGKGCNACNNTGYQGRTGVYEIMPMTAKIRQFINKGESSDAIKEQAIAEGMNTLRDSCIRHVLEGITTVEELIRVAYSL